VIEETLGCTTLGVWSVGRRVNLESCCTPTTLLGGHIVQGHVDGVGRVMGGMGERKGEHRVRIGLSASLNEYLVPKGSVCVDGVSLTIAGLCEGGGAGLDGGLGGGDGGWFEVALIPTTLDMTTLGDLAEGSCVNLEMDVLSKTIVHWARTHGARD